MQTVQAVMLLLGCSHDVEICEPAELVDPYYASMQKCEADIPAQEHFAEGYPLTIAQCLDVNDLPSDQLVKIQWYFDKNGILIAKAGELTDPLLNRDDQSVELASHQDQQATQ